MSRLFGSTLREAPAGAEAASHALLVRAGYIRQLGQGLFTYLPLARRALDRIERIIREEVEAIGGQEITMPVVNPAEPWKASGRWSSTGAELTRFRDRRDRDMVLAMTHEEIVTDLCRSEIRSYKQLPKLVYQVQTKFRDDPRPRAGLIRVREFTMKDSYSLDADEHGLEIQYQAHKEAYGRIFQRCGLPVREVGADSGMMGGSTAHEFMYLTPVGEDSIVTCPSCGYAANRQVAVFRKDAVSPASAAPLARVATPDCTTIDQLAAFLHVQPSQTAKAVMMMAAREGETGTEERFVFAVVRGDMEVNETKLANAVKAERLRPATEEEIRAAGAVPGYASPVRLDPAAVVVVDDIVPGSPNLVAGANEPGFHLLNTNVPRDYAPGIIADIAAASPGHACARCGSALSVARGVEVGNIFKLGTRYSSALGATFLDADGVNKPIVMGSYGIGVGRLLACIAEEHHDDHGLAWPATVAPFSVSLLSLGTPGSAADSAAREIYEELRKAGIPVLFDDRAESPGVKFAD
ncbi:MAG TPA: proline--tRNA ligase, partial [Spirochaetia bacterium]|nr:proline--tRNA ligase [Spirochaetia bacterium]